MTNYVQTATSSSNNGVPLPEAILTVYSRDIYFAAQPIMRFEQFARIKDELGTAPGLTISMLVYDSLGGSYTLTENVDMETDVANASNVTITVAERGKAVSCSELLLRASYTDVLADRAQLLGMHLAKNRDAEHRDTLYTSTNVLYAGGKTARTAITTGDIFDVDLIRELVERMATNKVPKIPGVRDEEGNVIDSSYPAYVVFIHPHQAKTLRKDSAWVNAQNYANATALFSGEIGRFEDVRFIETTQVKYMTAADGSVYADGEDTGVNNGTYSSATAVYQAIAIGDHAWGFARSLEAELRDNGVHDFGRRHDLAYYGIWGMGLIKESSVQILETA